MSRDVVIIGSGMHPWGKWGRNFVEYGVHAARAALKDAEVDWQDIQFVAGGATICCGGAEMLGPFEEEEPVVFPPPCP